MTLHEVKALLHENNIPYEMCMFENEAAYWHHIMLFPHTKNAKACKVIALIIKSNNGTKNIELQFNYIDDKYRFAELYFGDFSFDMFDYNEEMLADGLLNNINEMQNGSYAVIVGYDIKNRKWLGDACFNLNDDGLFGKPGFEKAMKRILNIYGQPTGEGLLIQALLNSSIFCGKILI